MDQDTINKPLSPDKAAKVEQAFSKALGKIEEINPEIAARVQKKYEEDRQEFAKAAQDFTPSQEPKYWAKKSCSKCYGRGIIGNRHVFLPDQPALSTVDETGRKRFTNSLGTRGISCSCAGKRYQKWLAEFRLFYNALKAQMVGGETDVEQEA
jgi:hypothetical protein